MDRSVLDQPIAANSILVLVVQSGAMDVGKGKVWLCSIIILPMFQFFASLLVAFRHVVGESFGRRRWLETFEKRWSPETHWRK
jgi:hypothetical protein